MGRPDDPPGSDAAGDSERPGDTEPPGDSERPVGQAPRTSTEGPWGHEARPPTDDRAVPWRVFLAVGAFYALLGAVYGAASYEWSGTAMLALAGAFGVWCAAYLWLHQRPRVAHPGHPEPGAEPGATGYLPHASVWPFALGLGAATVLNGLVLGVWVIGPGVALMALGVGGLVRQTRHRD